MFIFSAASAAMRRREKCFMKVSLDYLQSVCENQMFMLLLVSVSFTNVLAMDGAAKKLDKIILPGGQ